MSMQKTANKLSKILGLPDITKGKIWSTNIPDRLTKLNVLYQGVNYPVFDLGQVILMKRDNQLILHRRGIWFSKCLVLYSGPAQGRDKIWRGQW